MTKFCLMKMMMVMWLSNLPEGAISVCTHYTQTDILFTEGFSSDPASPNLPLMILLEKYLCYLKTSLSSSWLHLHLNDYLNNNVIIAYSLLLSMQLWYESWWGVVGPLQCHQWTAGTICRHCLSALIANTNKTESYWWNKCAGSEFCVKHNSWKIGSLPS